ncbi:MAG: hypothetical protein JWM14_2647 [Chitinophagaceae bacterium]|nr:hypothetical protein [Chitinophagaceae bacterium]
MGLIIALLLYLTLQVMFRLNTFLHELSHAVPALLLTKDKVTIHLGSYGQETGNIHFRAGRLEWFVKYNIFSWSGGLCRVYDPECSTRTNIIYTLCGPVFPFLLSLSACIIFLLPDGYEWYKIFFCLFTLVTFSSMVRSLVPSRKPVIMADGNITYNDGESIRRQLSFGKAKSFYDKAVSYYNKQAYPLAIVELEQLLLLKPTSSQAYEVLISCYMQEKNYKQAKGIAVRYVEHCKGLDDREYAMIAYVYSQLNELERSLHYYSEALKINPRNSTVWNNKGYALNLLGYYEKAIPCFSKAISLHPLFAFAYNNLGYARIKMGELEEGFKSIKHSHRLDMNNAYVYRNFGIYYLEKKEYAEALKQLKKAKEIDATVPELEELLSKASYYAAE